MDAIADINLDQLQVSIPRWRMKQDSSSRYTVFVLEVSAPVAGPPSTPVKGSKASGENKGGENRGFRRWIIERRYSDFRRFHSQLKRRIPELEAVAFPAKTSFFFTLAQSTIRHRQTSFQQYLNILFTLDPLPPEVPFFLEVAQHSPTFANRATSYSGRGSWLSDASLSRSLSAGTSSGISVSDFALIKVIGQGSFGKVFLVRPKWVNDNTVYAMKVIKKEDVRRRNQMEHTMAERRIMAQIRHPFIITLYYAFQSRDKLYMITEYCQGGELFYHLKRMRRFKEPVMRFYIAEVGLALEHLHSFDVIYRDLKPENILLNQDGNVKLTDFGLSKDHVSDGDATKTFCGTPEYLAPEMIINRKKQTGYTKAVDWWSLGIVSYEMLTGWPPFFDRNFNTMCEKILRKPVRFPAKYRISADAQDFISGLLQRNPEIRIGNTPEGFEAMKRHAFFSGVDWIALLRCEVAPPFKPPSSNAADDTRNIDKEFLKMAPQETPVQQSVMDRLSNHEGETFQDFSYADRTSILS